MTNREWFMKVLSQMNDVAFCNFIQDGSLHQYLYWCCDCNQNKSCAECKEKWCNAIHQEEMPELKVGDFVKLKNFGEYLKENPMPHITNGMFVKVRYDFDCDLENNRCRLGVTVDNRIIYVDGGWDTFNTGDDSDVRLNEIIAIYNAKSFDDCLDSSTCIWKREER